MKPALRSGDFWSGLVLAALGTYIVVTAHAWDYITEEGPGAGFFPMWYGGAMIALSLALALGAVLMTLVVVLNLGAYATREWARERFG